MINKQKKKKAGEELSLCNKNEFRVMKDLRKLIIFLKKELSLWTARSFSFKYFLSEIN